MGSFGQAISVLALVAVIQLGSALNLNDPCTNPEGAQGRCIFFRECQPLVAIFNTSLEAGNFVKRSRCGSMDGRAMVCCAGIDAGSRASGGRALPKPPQCGQDLSDRIVGGQPTELDEFPWTALLLYRKPTGDYGFHCGGSLINNRYVLTAAHCINAIPAGWQVVGVRLGEYDLSNNGLDCVGDVCTDKPVDMDIERVIVHENYNPLSKNQWDDIALIRFTRDLSYSAFVKPICLPVGQNERSRIQPGTKAVAAGWGRTETASASAVKLKVGLDIFDWNRCSTLYRSAGINLRNTQMCAGGKRGEDTCSGDSGGPLMRRIGSSHYLFGIVSFGPNKCGTAQVPGVYTDAGKYIDWIESRME